MIRRGTRFAVATRIALALATAALASARAQGQGDPPDKSRQTPVQSSAQALEKQPPANPRLQQTPTRSRPSSRTASDVVRLNRLLDSLLQSKKPEDSVVATVIARQLLERPTATASDSARLRDLVQTAVIGSALLPLHIVTMAPDTALAGEVVELALSRALAPPSVSLDSLARSTWVRFGATYVPIESVADTRDRIRVTVPDDAKRGESYSVRVWYAGDSSDLYTRFVAGRTVMQTLLQPSRWSPWLTGVITFVILALIGAWQTVRRGSDKELAERQKAELANVQTQVEQLNRLRLQREFQATSVKTPPGSNAIVRGNKPVIVPDVPDALVQVIASGQSILYAGIGLSAQANLPTAFEILSEMLDEVPQDREQLAAALTPSRYSELAELLVRRRGRDSIITSMTRLLDGGDTRTTPVHKALCALPFVGAVSTAWDSILERGFTEARGDDVLVLNAGQSETASRMPTTDEFVVAKPFGSISRPETFQFTVEDAARAIDRNRSFYRTIAAMLGSRSVFFVGVSVRSIQDLLGGARLTLSDRPHYAFVPSADATPLQRELLQSKYGIELIPYDPTPGYPEFQGFVEKLSARVRQSLAATQRDTLQKAQLTAVTLTNIGAFKHLSLSLNPQWNVILGNNGSGKSTLLRAIALGICGDDVEASRSARRLLRAGRDVQSGTIELTFGDTKYTTRLFKDGDSVRVESQFTPLQQGQWVVMGFPPLRGVSTQESSGPGPSGPDKPVVADLLPLIRGTIDDRLNNLKQWLVNIDYGMRSDDATKRDVSTRLHSSFWSLLKLLTPGVRIEPGYVDSTNFQVYVRTEDGEVSIDQVSQGMSSVFGWIGAALQRMYEIHGRAAKPEAEPALILVDEIDAHLHPEWQQRLISLLREYFPQLQIIATSHSPLVVAGMQSHEVFVSSRDDDDRTNLSLLPVPSDVKFELLRFDQILMSPLFGLTSTRSETSKKEYVKLAAKPASQRTTEEQQRYLALRAMLLDSTQPQSSEQGRVVAQAVHDAVATAIREKSDPEALQKAGKLTPEVVAELRARMAEISPESLDDTRNVATPDVRGVAP